MKRILISMIMAVCAAGFAMAKTVSSEKGIAEITSVSRNFGDGEKVSSIIIKYKKALNPDTVSARDFAVEGQEIESVVVGKTFDAERKNTESVAGQYVTLTLKYVNKWDATNGKMPEHPKKEGEKAGGGPRFGDEGTPVDLTATVTQVGEVKTTSGIVYSAGKAMKNTAVKEVDMEGFKKHSFTDSETGITLPYFVYLPDGYKKSEKYPLVFFVPDASADTSIDTATLTQGNGATIWTSSEEQAKHKTIVVAVQYPLSVVKKYGALTGDGYKWTKGLTAVYNLLQNVVSEYSVDQNRIYGTGQSQGCMTNIALSDRSPDLFAAQFLVAGQWNVEEMAAMKDKKLWIVVCEGDDKAYPGMTAAVNLWESLGSKVARGESFWKLKATEEEKKADTDAMLSKNADIMFNVIEGGSHMYTWTLAYNIEGIRDWLFAQSK